MLAVLERQAVEGDLRATERINRMVETLGHRTDDGGRGWQDPATGRIYQSIALYVIRPDQRVLAPLDLDGSEDPATEVRATTDDLLELGYRDAYRLFVEPVVGAVPETPRGRPRAATAGGRAVSAEKEGGGRPRRGIGTRAVHGNGGPRQGPLTTPIVQSSTFVFDSAGEMRRMLEGDPDLAFEFYTRYGNPTLRALEDALAALEGAEAGVVFASGMAAATTGILSVLEAPGDEVLASASLYGGTTKFVRDILPKWGMTSRIVAPADLLRLREVAGAAQPPRRPREPHQPRGRGHRHRGGGPPGPRRRPRGDGRQHVRLAVPAAPARPGRGHRDAQPDQGPRRPQRHHRRRAGGQPRAHGEGARPAQGAGRLLRSRIRRSSSCAASRPCTCAWRGSARTRWPWPSTSRTHPKVARVIYPGLPEHPGHEVARRQMSAFGGMVAFVLRGGLPSAERFYDGLRLMARAASLGGVETLVSLPVHTSHHGYSEEQLRAAGIDPGLVRVSLGVEDAADLIADADAALAGVPAA